MKAAAQSHPEQSPRPYGGPDPVQLRPTEKQMAFARKIATRRAIIIPWNVQQSRQALSRWIDRNLTKPAAYGGASELPTSRQVAFAERLAMIKRTDVPRECFKSRQLMSRWIDNNKLTH